MSNLSERKQPGIYILNNPVSTTIEYFVDNERFTLNQDESVTVIVRNYLQYNTIGNYMTCNRIGNLDNVINAGYNPN